MKLPIYMDSHASTPVDPRVFETMTPYFTEIYGNSSSIGHSFGMEAENAVKNARELTARLFDCESSEIIFTSGATESNNIAIRGAAERYISKGNHLITSQIEHPSVLQVFETLRQYGFEITYLPVDKYGLVDPGSVKDAIKDNTVLVSIMASNNEIGTIQPLIDIGEITRSKGVLFHVDAAQSAGKVPLSVNVCNIDLLSVSSHKFYGPKGVGALYIRKKNPRVKLKPQIAGGGHEKGLRSGTLNVPGIVGLGKACEISLDEMSSECKKLGLLRDRLLKNIMDSLDEVYLIGHPEKKLPHSLNLGFKYVEAASIIMELREIALSASSACTSTESEASHVLKAIGVDEDLESSCIRFGLHRYTTQEEVDYTSMKIIETVKKLQKLSPLYKKNNII